MSTPQNGPVAPTKSHLVEKILAFSVALVIGFMAGLVGLLASNSTTVQPLLMMTVFGVVLLAAAFFCGIVFPQRNYWPIVLGVSAPAVLFVGFMGLAMMLEEGTGDKSTGILVPVASFLGAAVGAAAGGGLRRLFARVAGMARQKAP